MKWFKRIAIGTFLLLFVILATVFTLWMKPSLIFTDSRLNSLADKLPFSKKPAFIHLKIDDTGILGRTIHLDLGAFCISDPDACFKEFSFNVAFRITKIIHFELLDLGPVIIKNEYVKIVLLPDKKSEEKKKEDPKAFDITHYLSLAKDFRLKKVDIDFPKITIESADEVARANFNLDGTSPEAVKIVSRYMGGGVDAKATLNTKFTELGRSPVHASFEAIKDWKVEGELQGMVTWENLFVDLKGEAKLVKLIPWVHTLYLKNLCFSRNPDLSLSSDMIAKVSPVFTPQKKESALPKANFELNLTGKVDVKAEENKYLFKAQIGPDKQKGIELSAEVDGEYPLKLYQFYVDLRVPEFQSLVQSLKNTNFEVIAPFLTLAGPIEMRVGELKDKISMDGTNQVLPISLMTDLKAPEQIIKTESKGKAKFAPDFKRIDITGETLLQSIRFTFPKFDLLTPEGALTRDSRIVSNAKVSVPKLKSTSNVKASEGTDLEFDWKIKSIPGALQVFYPVMVPYAPLNLNWNLSSKASSGALEVLPFEIHYMDRVAKLENFTYSLAVGEKDFHFSGKLSVPKTDYNIIIEVFDEVGKPKVTLKSEPPLSEDDIVSVLLFNQTASELSPDQTSSVNSTQSAITNRALGLFSIWALSSTPVEAVNYNPSSKVYSARVRLANGVTATVGTNWDKAQEVALRKRLGKNFVLSTILDSGSSSSSRDQSDSKKALIEWFKRF